MLSRTWPFIYIFVGYVLIGLFQFWVSDFFYAFGLAMWTFKNLLNSIFGFFGLSVSSYVLVLYGSLIFLLLYRLLRSLYLSVKK